MIAKRNRSTAGNVLIDTTKYGVEIGVVNSHADKGNVFEYDVVIPQAGSCVLQIRYAAAMARPAELHINGKKVRDQAIARTTGGWYPDHQKWHTEGVFEFREGVNTLQLKSGTMAHIDRLRLIVTGENRQLAANIARIDTLNEQLKALSDSAPTAPTLSSVVDGEIQNTKIHLRGDHNSLGDIEPRHFLTLVRFQNSSDLPDKQSGRRELADWLTSKEHPLTARVIVNRVWGWHFGKGLVSTPDNFGVMGGRPTHPQLLDNLALEFIQDGWSLKQLHRRILLSSTWQLASDAVSADAVNKDPGNVLYWRFNERRLEAEAIRDAMLALSGDLDQTVGGPAIEGVESTNLSVEAMAKNFSIYEQSRRRSVYLPVIRSAVYDVLALYDFPGSSVPTGRRSVTTVPTQALMMMNSAFVFRQAETIAKRHLQAAPNAGAQDIISQLYESIFSRPPSADETRNGLAFIAAFSNQPPASASTAAQTDSVAAAWAAYCQVLLMSNDFVYLR